MIRGIYIAATGMLVQSMRTENFTNNLANVDTTGFKKELSLFSTNRPYLIYRISNQKASNVAGFAEERAPIGNLSYGCLYADSYVDSAQGPLKKTDNPLDVALCGDGYFVVNTSQGVRYTRDGGFVLNKKGELTTREGDPVLGEKGVIRLGRQALQPQMSAEIIGEGKVEIDEQGVVFLDKERIDTLKIVNFKDKAAMRKVGRNLYDTQQVPQLSQAEVKQGYLEGSNVETIREMVSLIEAFRAYEVASRVLQSHDELLDRAVNEIGRSAR